MKIASLKEFRAMPSGTLFMKYQPCVFDTLCAKSETLDSDFLYENIVYEIDCTGSEDFVEKLRNAEEKGNSLLMDFDCAARDGAYQDAQLFAVYERKDIEMLIDKLNRCKAQAYA